VIFSPFERMLALRYLRARRQEEFVSVITGFSLGGIALGVAALIIVMSIFNGFRVELLDRILGINSHLGVYGTAGPLQDFDALAVKLRKIPGVVRVAPVVNGQAMATVRGTARGAVVRGMRPADLASHPVVADNIKAGSLTQFKGNKAIAVGTGFARHLGLVAGDSVTLVSPLSKVTAFGSVPRLKSFRIAAVFKVGMSEYDNNFVFMPLAAAQRFFRTGKGVTSLEVMLTGPDDVATAKPAIRAVAGMSVRLVDWQQANASFYTAIQVERNVTLMIVTLVILVAAFNIISGLIMLVKDKGRDIAILRTMGATRGMVMRIFFLAGAMIGVIGTAVGFVLGLTIAVYLEDIRQWLKSLTNVDLFAEEIYFLSKVPSQIEAGDVIGAVAMALSLSFLATIYPAWRAARTDPVEALRYE
jgi:lipoprotein-releasing system permease protein